MRYLLIALVLFMSNAVSPQKLQDVNIDFMVRGGMYAQSSVIDTTALGGYGGSDNSAKQISTLINLPEAKNISLHIDTSKSITIAEKYNGYKFYIANQTDSVVGFLASDSRLSVIAEVYYDKKWQPIEYLPSSGCGNSYHHLYLKPNEYWEFEVPKFKGKIPVKLRYRLALSRNSSIYSNEIEASINKKQLSVKQGYTNQGLMDPYFE